MHDIIIMGDVDSKAKLNPAYNDSVVLSIIGMESIEYNASIIGKISSMWCPSIINSFHFKDHTVTIVHLP